MNHGVEPISLTFSEESKMVRIGRSIEKSG